MNSRSHDESDADASYPELNRAAGAGLRLTAARTRFRRAAAATFADLADAGERLDACGYESPRRAVRTAFDAAHGDYARFVHATGLRWEDEDGFVPALPRGEPRRRSRLDDLGEGLMPPVADGPEIPKVFQECARAEFSRDRPAAQRLLCVALLWSVDIRHESEDPAWARRQGVFPGADAAPTMARLLTELAHRTEAPASARARALRDAAAAMGRIPALARIFGSACCCAFEYETVLAPAV